MCARALELLYFQVVGLAFQYSLSIGIKVCQDFNCTWAWELESKGYPEMTVESKTGILKVCYGINNNSHKSLDSSK